MKSEPNPDWKPPTKEMRGEGAGKGDQLRRGVNWKQYGKNYDSIFRKKRKTMMFVTSDLLAMRKRLAYYS